VDVHAYMAERIPLVDAELERLLPKASEAPEGLHAAMRHLVFPSGKRFRPILAIAGAEAVAGRGQDALPMAAAVELVHTYTLIHDDLPCMDDDAERRGRPTVHVAHSEALAVLAGDALQALAFEVLATPADESSATRISLCVRELARAIGSRELVGGQADDLEYAPEDLDRTRIESVHARKSAALIAVSITGGARLAGADDEVLERLRQFGLEVGVAFQIADDLLDEGEDDLCSLVRVLGTEGARARADELLARALGRIDDLGERAEPLRELARFAVQRTV
jgi:geranylgeranyl pyrophosphate synthase